jgi:hypothetical protein
MLLGRPFEVKGSCLEIVPKSRSQVSCGFSHSTCNHREVTPSIKIPFLGSLGGAVTSKERLGEKFSVLIWGYKSEEGVSKAACLLAEPKPLTLDSVVVFVAALLSAINDEAVV